jgi:hypothetical protein
VVKPLLASLFIALLSIAVIACGGGDKSSSSSATTAIVPGTKDAYDGDFLTQVDKDDDGEVVEYGNAANPADKLAIASFVRQFYKAADASDGTALCSLVVPSLAKQIPKEFGKASDPPYLQGKTCAEIMTRLYRYNHRQINTEATGFKLTGARVKGDSGYALLAFTTMREPRFIFVERKGGTWKMADELIDSHYP